MEYIRVRESLISSKFDSSVLSFLLIGVHEASIFDLHLYPCSLLHASV